MRSEFAALGSEPGVQGPPIVVNQSTAEIRLADLSTVVPSESASLGGLVLAHVVWVGRFVCVVSAGVPQGRRGRLAARLRAFLAAPALPLVFTLSPRPDERPCVAVSVQDTSCQAESVDLARAQAFVLVQCAWLETPDVLVQLDSEEYRFLLEFSRREVGMSPVLTLIHPVRSGGS